MGYRNYADAGSKLSVLDSNTSPMLELFWVISSNTAVPAPEISSQFQAPQTVVPPTNPDSRLLAQPNQPYIAGLQGLEGAVKNLTTVPNPSDPSAVAPVNQAAVSAEQAAENLRNGFTPDRTANLDQTSFRLLQAPIEAAKALAAQAPAQAAGGGAKAFCAQAAPVLAKFPFNPQSTVDATPEEVAQVFRASAGSLLAVLQQRAQVDGGADGNEFLARVRFAGSHRPRIPLVPESRGNDLLGALPRRRQHAHAELHPHAGQGRQHSQRRPEYRWPVARRHRLSRHLPLDGTAFQPHHAQRPINPPPYQGTWSVFRFAYDAEHPAPNRLKGNFQFNNRSQGVVIYDVSGPRRSAAESRFHARRTLRLQSGAMTAAMQF